MAQRRAPSRKKRGGLTSDLSMTRVAARARGSAWTERRAARTPIGTSPRHRSGAGCVSWCHRLQPTLREPEAQRFDRAAQGYKATRLQGYKATRLQGYKATRLLAGTSRARRGRVAGTSRHVAARRGRVDLGRVDMSRTRRGRVDLG
eukprot:1742144-Prymnesium_polylepis.1